MGLYQFASWAKNTILSFNRGNQFSFAIVKMTGGGHRVYYSYPRIVNGVTWPSAVILMQAFSIRVNGKKPGDYFLGNSIFRSNLAVQNSMVQAMARFCGLTARDAYASYSSSDTKEFAPISVFELDGANIFTRPKLARFNSPTVGPAPNINLANAIAWDLSQGTLATQAVHFHRLYMLLAFNRMLRRRFNRRHIGQYNQHYNIGAVFVTRQGEVKAIAYNMAKDNYTYHAEVNLLQAVLLRYGGGLAPDPYIYSTLRPCDMCHSMIRQYFPNAQVIYSQDDPGGHVTYNHLHTHKLSDIEHPIRTYGVHMGTLAKTGGSSLGGGLTQIKNSLGQYVVVSLRHQRSLDEMITSQIMKMQQLLDKYVNNPFPIKTHKAQLVRKVLSHILPAFRDIA